MSNIVGGYQDGRLRVTPENERCFEVIGVQEITPHHQVMVCDDDRASFMFTKRGYEEEDMPEVTSLDKVDYNMLPPPELQTLYEGTKFEEKGLPLSFLNVNTIEEGERWYAEHTRYPECLLPYLARYQWGDLRKGVNKKALKNARKKKKRKERKHKAKETYKVIHAPSLVKFD